MRLSIMREIIDEAQKDLVLKAEGNIVSEISKLRGSLNLLRDVEIFNSLIDDIYALLPAPDFKDKAALADKVIAVISERLAKLRQEILLTRKVINKSLNAINGSDVFIKLPNYDRLHGIYDDLKKLDNSFNSALSEAGIENDIKFKGVESGSSWIILELGLLTVSPILTMLYFANQINKFMNESELSRARLNAEKKSLETQNRINDSLQFLLDEQIRELGATCSNRLGVNSENTENSEKVLRITHSLKQISEIFAQGGKYEVPKITHDEGKVSRDILPEPIKAALIDVAVKTLLPK